MASEDRWLSCTQIAKMLSLNNQTIRGWLRDGLLKGVNVGGSAGYRVKESDLQAFLAAKAKR